MRTLESLRSIAGVIDVNMYAEGVRVDREKDHYGLTAELVITCDKSVRLATIRLPMGELLLCYGAAYYCIATAYPEITQIHGRVEITYALYSAGEATNPFGIAEG